MAYVIPSHFSSSDCKRQVEKSYSCVIALSTRKMFPSGNPQNQWSGFPPSSPRQNQLSPHNSSHQQYPNQRTNSGPSVSYHGGNFYNFTFATPGSYHVALEHQPRGDVRGNGYGGYYYNHTPEDTRPAGVMRNGQFSSHHHHHQNHVSNAPQRRLPVPTCRVDSFPRMNTSYLNRPPTLSSERSMSSPTSSNNWSTGATFGSTQCRSLMSDYSRDEDDDSVEDFPCPHFRIIRLNQSM